MKFQSEEDRIKNFRKGLLDEELDTGVIEFLSYHEDFTQWLIDNGFFTAPASTKYHGAYEGGLYDHSSQVYERLQILTDNNGLIWQRPISPFIIGMFHDLCKIDQYKKVAGQRLNGSDILIQGDNLWHYEYNTDTVLKGHGAKSVMLLSQFFPLTEEEVLCIRYHMGAYEKEEWNEFDQAIRKYENVLWTHTADMIASKVDDM